MKTRPFERDDYAAFAGVQGQNPRISETSQGTRTWIAITDDTGLSVHQYDSETEDYYDGWWHIPTTQKVANYLISQIPAEDLPRIMGDIAEWEEC